jgi:hypothetical protein
MAEHHHHHHPIRAALAAAGLIMLTAAGVSAQRTSRCGAAVHVDEGTGFVLFPQDRLFCPLIGDPKEPRSFISYQRGEFRTVDDPGANDRTDIGSVGLGDAFGLFRSGGPTAGEGVQLDLAGSIFAQFDLARTSTDLINADYIVGLPLTIRRAAFSTRIRLYHQSSHLGDEYLLRAEDVLRENLSFESIELLLSQELGPLRAYAGGEVLVRRDPDTLGKGLLHGGLELRTLSLGRVRALAALDVKAADDQDFSPAWSGRAGIELARSAAPGHPTRLVQLVAEYYRGPSPYGQFFQDDIEYYGIGIHFSL